MGVSWIMILTWAPHRTYSLTGIQILKKQGGMIENNDGDLSGGPISVGGVEEHF